MRGIILAELGNFCCFLAYMMCGVRYYNDISFWVIAWILLGINLAIMFHIHAIIGREKEENLLTTEEIEAGIEEIPLLKED